MEIEVISKETLPQYQGLILPYIYEELEQYEDDLDCEYICLAARTENEDGILLPVSAVIGLMEPYGDIAILSIYTLPDHRRKGYASELLDKVIFVARRLFIWDSVEDDEEDISVKALYRLAPEREAVFEAFLKKNHFTDFYLLDEDGEYKVWAGIEEVRFYKTAEELEADAARRAEAGGASPESDAGEAADHADAVDEDTES